MKFKIILIVAQIVLLAAVAGGVWWFTKPDPVLVEGEEAAAAEQALKEPIYYSIDPSFVVNLMDSRSIRFVQIQVDLMTRDEEVAELLEKYLPRIRNDLIMQFSKLNREAIEGEAARIKIQQEALNTVNAVLKAEAGRGGVEAVYFSKFVMQ